MTASNNPPAEIVADSRPEDFDPTSDSAWFERALQVAESDETAVQEAFVRDCIHNLIRQSIDNKPETVQMFVQNGLETPETPASLVDSFFFGIDRWSFTAHNMGELQEVTVDIIAVTHGVGFVTTERDENPVPNMPHTAATTTRTRSTLSAQVLIKPDGFAVDGTIQTRQHNESDGNEQEGP